MKADRTMGDLLEYNKILRKQLLQQHLKKHIMKAIKTIFAILFVSSIFVACENDTINEEVGIEEIEVETIGETENEKVVRS